VRFVNFLEGCVYVSGREVQWKWLRWIVSGCLDGCLTVWLLVMESGVPLCWLSDAKEFEGVVYIHLGLGLLPSFIAWWYIVK
jgi:hypothetical protein